MFGIDTLYGLPLHVLIVHVAVVLVPLAAGGLIVTGWREDWRRAYAMPLALLAIAGAIASFIATQTGGVLRGHIRDAARAAGTRADFGAHPGDGNHALIFAIVFAFAASALWAVQRWHGRLNLAAWTPTAMYALSAVAGLAAIVMVVLAGHSGSALVWKDIGNFVSPPGR